MKPLPYIAPNPCADMLDGAGWICQWPDGRWWWHCDIRAAVDQAVAWFQFRREEAA